MAQETVKAFFQQVQTDQNLNDQFRTFAKGMVAAKVDEAAAVAQTVAFASQQGYAFTAEEMQLAAMEIQGEDGALTDEQLNGVAGGAVGMSVGKGWYYVVNGYLAVFV